MCGGKPSIRTTLLRPLPPPPLLQWRYEEATDECCCWGRTFSISYPFKNIRQDIKYLKYLYTRLHILRGQWIYMRVLHILWIRNKIVRTSIAVSGRGDEEITYIHFQFLYVESIYGRFTIYSLLHVLSISPKCLWLLCIAALARAGFYIE